MVDVTTAFCFLEDLEYLPQQNKDEENLLEYVLQQESSTSLGDTCGSMLDLRKVILIELSEYLPSF